MSQQVRCPKCDSSDVLFSKKHGRYICEDCQHAFEIETQVTPKRIFISYGHDEHAALAQRMQRDFESRGHKVWFDVERLKPGADWEVYIEAGLDWVADAAGDGRVVLLMTPHSVRRPDGYCLNEIARALSRRLRVTPVMVVWSEPPLSICRIQWLDMQDCIPLQDREERYETKFQRLAEALEHDRLNFEGAQSRLLNLLEPLPFDADIAQHLADFTGRRWVFDEIDGWLADPEASRIFWITGKPGVGKTAIATWLCYNRREIAAFHLCRFGHTQKADPRRCVSSIAYQLSSQLPEYQARLMAMNLETLVPESSARTLFDALIVQPLSGNFPAPPRTIVVLIDALDEANEAGKNDLASFIASEFLKTPQWLRLIITSRPDPEVMHPLQALTPHVLDTSSPQNKQDLREYLQRQLKSLAGKGEVADGTIESIIRRSEGVFLYVKWVAEELRHGRLSLDREDFPQGLGGVFAQFFERQFPDSARYAREIRPALEVVAAAQEPLPLEMLEQKFNWSEHERIDFCRSLGSLFAIVDRQIQPFHRLIVEWLTNADKADRYFLSAEEGHRLLAELGWQQYQRGVPSMCSYMLYHLPAHLLRAKQWERIAQLLCDLELLEAQARIGLVFNLAGTFSEAIGGMPIDHPRRAVLQLLEEAIRRDIHFMARHPSTLFQCLWNSCWWYDCADAAKHYAVAETSHSEPPGQQASPQICDLAESWRERKQAPGFLWVRSLRPPDAPLGTAQKAVLRGHVGAVWSVAYSPDGQHIASGSVDKTARVWNAFTGQELLCLREGIAAVWSVAFTPDGRHLVMGTQDHQVRLWNLAEDRIEACLSGHRDDVETVHVSSDGRLIASGSRDGTARVWSVAECHELWSFRGHRGAVRSVYFSPDGRCLLTASDDRTVRVLDVATGTEIKRLEGHDNSVRCAVFSPDGGRVVSASFDQTVRLWDLDRAMQVACLQGHNSRVRSARFFPDGSRVASVSDDGMLRIWSADAAAEILAIDTRSGPLAGLAVSSDGQEILTGSWDSTVRRWSLRFSSAIRAIRDHIGRVTQVTFSADGAVLVTGADDGIVRTWNVADGTLRRCLYGHEGPISCVATFGAGRIVASGSQDGTLRLWDAFTPRELARRKVCWVQKVRFSDDGRQLFYRPLHARTRVWDMQEVSEVLSPQSPPSAQEILMHCGEAATKTGHPINTSKLTSGACASGMVAPLFAKRWEARAGHLETVIQDATTHEPVAWFPERLGQITAHPHRPLWAGFAGTHLCLIELVDMET